jgi:crotonobetainyl-CoA:carnitine CoA-transferase CaiB-like acyl-CoA transferase
MAAFTPLAGIKVIDFSHVIAGPLATFMLAQMGADVLKIESKNGGDVMRRGEKGAQGFLALNAGKRSAAYDIADAKDRAALLELIGEADVLVDNLKPGTLDKHGLGWEQVRALNSRLIYCAISGFGRASDWAGRPAYDHVVQAASGMTFVVGNEGDPPCKIGFTLVDQSTALLAAFAIVSALHERRRTGAGMLVDVSMAGAALQLLYPSTVDALTDGSSPRRVGNQALSGSPASDLYPTRGDGWIAIAANTPKQFLALLDVLGSSHIARDPALFERPLDAKAPAAFLRAKDGAAVKRALGAALAEHDAADLERRLTAAGVPAAKVRRLAEFAREAVTAGVIEGVRLEGEGVSVVSPGLGFRVERSAS